MRAFLLSIVAVLIPFAAQAQSATQQVQDNLPKGGISAIWILANFSYAGMRAQGSESYGWRTLAFLFGFPGTFLTWMTVEENSERVYGVEVPRRRIVVRQSDASPPEPP